MKYWILAVFAAATMVVPAQAQTTYDEDRVLYRVSSDDLRAIVEHMGYKVSNTIRREGGFTLDIDTRDRKPNFGILADKCSQPLASCATVALTWGGEPGAGLTTEIIKQLNAEYIPKIGVLTVEPPFGLPGADYEMVLIRTRHIVERGMTMDNLRLNISVFARELAKIVPKIEFIDSHVVQTLTLSELRGLVRNLGYSSGLASFEGEGFSVLVLTPSPKSDFNVSMEQCEKQANGCSTMRLQETFIAKEGVTLETVNSLNNQFGAKVMLETDPSGRTRVRVQSHHRLDSGVAMANLRANVEAYLSDLTAIQSQAGR